MNFYGSDPLETVITHSVRSLYGKGLDEIDPVTIAPTVTVPVFLSCGTKDFNTPCGDGGGTATGVKTLSEKFPSGIATFAELKDVVHILRDVGDADPQDPEEQLQYPYSVELEQELGKFLTRFTDG